MTKASVQESHNDLVMSFRAVRQTLGWLGLALPVVLILGALWFGQAVPPTISDAYYGPMADLFIGILCAIGVFLLTYKGYDFQPGDWLSDRWVSRLAGSSALGVALVPTFIDPAPPCRLAQCLLGVAGAATAHYIFGLLFFAAMATFCLVLFPKTDPHHPPTAAKANRNHVYRACGIILLATIITIGTIQFALPDTTPARGAVFWLEAVGVWAFGISWLVKGKMIGLLND